MQDKKNCFTTGRLQEDLQAQLEKVKQSPTNLAARKYLGELFCFAGELERADQQFEIVVDQEPQAVVSIALLRQLVRAEKSRRECFSEGRLPELLGEPAAALKQQMQVLLHMRQHAFEQATALIEEINQETSHLSFVCNGKTVLGARDLNDLTSSIFEVLTNNGKYYWVGLDQVLQITFHEPQSPSELLWRRVSMDVKDGPSGDVYIPVVYCPRFAEQDDQLKLALKTEWDKKENAPVAGLGQRMFLFGNDTLGIMELKTLVAEGS